jgi:hypothetical protein
VTNPTRFCPVFSVIVKKVPNALFQALDIGEIDLEDLLLAATKEVPHLVGCGGSALPAIFAIAKLLRLESTQVKEMRK